MIAGRAQRRWNARHLVLAERYRHMNLVGLVEKRRRPKAREIIARRCLGDTREDSNKPHVGAFLSLMSPSMISRIARSLSR